jgi:hypothetical protein
MRLRRRLRRTDGLNWLRLRASFGLIAIALAGCASTDQTITGSLPTGFKTITFESVDGPPKPVFDRLVAALAAEAERRELPVVSHSGPATYRVRAYLSAQVEKKKKQASLAWAWEVFDSSQNRAFRLAGEEPLGAPAKDVWAQCDDRILLRVAARGYDELAARLGPLPTPSPDRIPAASGPAVAFTDPGR